MQCVGDPTSAASRGIVRAVTPGTYTFKWLDGTSSGLYLTVAKRAANGHIPVDWDTTHARATAC